CRRRLQSLNLRAISWTSNVRPVEHLHEVAACDEQSDVAVPRGDHLRPGSAPKPDMPGLGASLGQGPIIGVTLNRECSRPNWNITSATRWIRTLSMEVG